MNATDRAYKNVYLFYQHPRGDLDISDGNLYLAKKKRRPDLRLKTLFFKVLTRQSLASPNLESCPRERELSDLLERDFKLLFGPESYPGARESAGFVLARLQWKGVLPENFPEFSEYNEYIK